MIVDSYEVRNTSPCSKVHVHYSSSSSLLTDLERRGWVTRVVRGYLGRLGPWVWTRKKTQVSEVLTGSRDDHMDEDGMGKWVGVLSSPEWTLSRLFFCLLNDGKTSRGSYKEGVLGELSSTDKRPDKRTESRGFPVFRVEVRRTTRR